MLHEINRTMVHTARRAARIPLTVLETATRHRGDEEWPPAIGFEVVAGRATSTVGRLLRDGELVDEGDAMSEQAERRREAVELDRIARRREAEADAELRRGRQEAEQRRTEAERRAEEREQAAERERQQRHHQADEVAAERERKAADEERKADEQVARKERAARRDAVAEERDAVKKAEQAARAEGQVVDLDKEITRSKTARSAR